MEERPRSKVQTLWVASSQVSMNHLFHYMLLYQSELISEITYRVIIRDHLLKSRFQRATVMTSGLLDNPIGLLCKHMSIENQLVNHNVEKNNNPTPKPLLSLIF